MPAPDDHHYLRAFLGRFATVHSHEIPILLHASSSFFFILSAYFMIIPFRDEAAISLGLNVLPLLFVASLLLTLVAAPISSHYLSLPSLPKSKALLIMYRFFGVSLVIFFILYSLETTTLFQGNFGVMTKKLNLNRKDISHINFVGLRVCFYIWIALLNLITTSSLWARLADVMDSEEGSRLFGFVGAGATLGQLTGSILAVILASFGPFLVILSAVFMELGARCASGIGQDSLHCWGTSGSDLDGTQEVGNNCKDSIQTVNHEFQSPPKPLWHKISSMLQGLRLILASGYLLHICCFLWLTAVVSSFFYFQRASVVAGLTHDPLGRRRLFAKINSFTAIFILFGQLTITGRVMPLAGISIALCASPVMAIINMTAIYVSPTSLVIALSEASRKVMTYVMTKPAREVLFTVISREEKYKAKEDQTRTNMKGRHYCF